MKSRFHGAIIATLFLIVSFVASANAQVSVSGYEHIEQFTTAVVVNKDSSTDITETIQYSFPEGEERHGIYRTIPLKDIRLSNISVTDENNTPYNFDTSRSINTETIKIGDADVAISGTHTYVIHYKVRGAISYLKDNDELYWNATGNEWNYPILNTRQTVTLPSVVNHDALSISCYQGAAGSTASCDEFITVSTNGQQTVIAFASSVALNPQEGITIAVGFPKGVVLEPTAWQKFLDALTSSIMVILSIILLGISIVYSIKTWLKRGREPKGSGVIIAQYDVPEQLHPAELSALLNKYVRNSDISAELINLAVKGYLKIEKIETKGILFKGDDYQLTLVKAVSNETDVLEKKLLNGIFGSESAVGKAVLLSELKGSFYQTVSGAKKQVMTSLVNRQYFIKNPVTTRMIATGIFVGGMFFTITFTVIAIATSGAWYVLPILLLALAILALCMFLSTPRTQKGVEVKEYSLGLKEYLQIAEKDRINFHNAPEKSPELFEKLLPYAMVLGVEKAWAKEFEGIYVIPPNWYVDPHMNGFNSLILVNSFSNFNTATASSFAPPSSASSGGGFSGGGSGGGGGGSW